VVGRSALGTGRRPLVSLVVLRAFAWVGGEFWSLWLFCMHFLRLMVNGMVAFGLVGCIALPFAEFGLKPKNQEARSKKDAARARRGQNRPKRKDHQKD